MKDVINSCAPRLSEIPASVATVNDEHLGRLGAVHRRRGRGGGRGDKADDEQEDGSNDEEEGEDRTVRARAPPPALVAVRKRAILQQGESEMKEGERRTAEGTYGIHCEGRIAVGAAPNLGLLIFEVLVPRGPVFD